MTQGAAMRSQRNAARKVNVRQRPCGTLAIRRVPRGERPWRRVILVLAQVSSMNTRRLGSSRPWYFFHGARRRAMSARSCSLACRLFFQKGFVVELSQLDTFEMNGLLTLLDTNGEINALVDRQFSRLNRVERLDHLRRRCSADMFVCLTRLGQPDGISPSRMAEMLEVDRAGPKVRC